MPDEENFYRWVEPPPKAVARGSARASFLMRSLGVAAGGGIRNRQLGPGGSGHRIVWPRRLPQSLVSMKS